MNKEQLIDNNKPQICSYLKKLLGNEKVQWKMLGEVCDIKKGKQLNKEFLSENGLYPAYNGGITYSGFSNKFNYNENTIIISQEGFSGLFVCVKRF